MLYLCMGSQTDIDPIASHRSVTQAIRLVEEIIISYLAQDLQQQNRFR